MNDSRYSFNVKFHRWIAVNLFLGLDTEMVCIGNHHRRIRNIYNCLVCIGNCRAVFTVGECLVVSNDDRFGNRSLSGGSLVKKNQNR